MAVLLGQNTTGVNSANSNAAGTAFGQRYQALSSGNVDTLWLFTGATGPSAGNVHAAVYSDSGTAPVTRLTADITTNFSANTWISASVVPGLAVTSGTFYWVVWLGVGATITYTNFAASGGSEMDSGSGQTTLPTTWPSGGPNANIANVFAESLPGGLEPNIDFGGYGPIGI
jgi:hypothetical protein